MKPLTKKQRWVAIGLFAVFATLLTFTLIIGRFGFYSVCDQCGALRHTTDWQLPLTSLTVFSHSTESETPLNQVLLTNSIVKPHNHHWLFGQGGGNGVTCAIGSGRHIRPAANSKEFADMILMLHGHGQASFRDRVLRGVFNPHTSHQFFNLSFDAPKETASDSEVQSWIKEESEYLDEMAAAQKGKN